MTGIAQNILDFFVFKTTYVMKLEKGFKQKIILPFLAVPMSWSSMARICSEADIVGLLCSDKIELRIEDH